MLKFESSASWVLAGAPRVRPSSPLCLAWPFLRNRWLCLRRPKVHSAPRELLIRVSCKQSVSESRSGSARVCGDFREHRVETNLRVQIGIFVGATATYALTVATAVYAKDFWGSKQLSSHRRHRGIRCKILSLFHRKRLPGTLCR